MSRRSAWLTVLLLTGSIGCAVGPRYRTPEIPVPPGVGIYGAKASITN